MNPLFLSSVLALLQTADPAPTTLAYRFDEVKRTVYRAPAGNPSQEIPARRGDPAWPGDRVRTGWLGQTVVSVPERKTRFEIHANTQVRLAGGEPGVLLEVQRGRLKALFEALTEGSREERRVAVPGALLAVRGTRYGIEVDRKGRSTLAVFEGVVEVLGTTPGMAPVRVKAGEWSSFGPGRPPTVETMHGRGFGETAWGQGMRPDGSMAPGGMAPGATMHKGMPRGSGPMGH